MGYDWPPPGRRHQLLRSPDRSREHLRAAPVDTKAPRRIGREQGILGR